MKFSICNIIALLYLLAISPVGFAKTIQIGASLPLSGKSAIDGKSMKYGLQLYVDKLNEAGGINGDRLEVKFLDDRNDKALAQTNAQTFVDDPSILAVIGHQFSSVAISAGEIYNREGLVSISPSASNPSVSRNGSWTFSMNYQDNRQGQLMAYYLSRVLNLKKIIVFKYEDAYGSGLLESFSKAAKTVGLKIVKVVPYDGNETFDEKFIKKNLKRTSSFDGVALLSHTLDGAKLTKAIRNMGHDQAIIGPDAFAKKSYIDGVKGKDKNIFIASPFLYELASLKTIHFQNDYKKRFASQYKVTPTVWAAFCYDAMHMIVEALKNGHTDRKSIRDFISSYNAPNNYLSSITGNLFFDKHGAMERPILMSTIQNGHFKPAFKQLKKVTEQHIVKNLAEEVKSGEIAIIDKTPYYITKIVYTGIDFIRINNIDIKDQNFEIEFFLWYKWQGDLNLDEIDFTNRVNKEEDKIEEIRKNFSTPTKYISFKVKETFLFPFDLSDFPFDTQYLPMILSHKNKDANRIMFVVDSNYLSSAKINTIYPEEWTYLDREDFSGTYEQFSSFGDPAYSGGTGAGKIDFSVYKTRVVLKRILFPYLVNLFMPLLIMIIISLMLFLIPLQQFDARISLVMTALLSVLVFHMSESESLPNVGYLIKADLFFIISYIFLFVLIVNTISANLFLKHKNKIFAEMVDKVSTFIFIPLVIVSFSIVTVLQRYYLEAIITIVIIAISSLVFGFWFSKLLVSKKNSATPLAKTTE